jgi:hypothetical protein
MGKREVKIDPFIYHIFSNKKHYFNIIHTRKFTHLTSGGASLGAASPPSGRRPWRSLEPSTIASSLSSQMMVFSITNRDFTLALPP